MSSSLKDTKGIAGLKNLGNSCFMNSVLQCLSQIDEFDDMLFRNGTLFKEWKDLKTLMWTRYSVISPNRFHFLVQEISKQKNVLNFSGYEQNDINEFLNFLINCFHEDTKRNVKIEVTGKTDTDEDEIAKLSYEMMKTMYEKEYSDIIKVFYGIHISFGHSLSGQILRKIPEPFFTVLLPLPKKRITTLEDCFDLYTEKDTLDENNLWFNEKTGRKEVIQNSIQFFTLPNILIITLKRFDNYGRKTNNYVSFPLENLNLSKYVRGYNKESYIYNLFGVCNHYGSLNSGHYTAFIKNKTCSSWTHMNDSSITVMNTKDVVTKYAYSLFYRKS